MSAAQTLEHSEHIQHAGHGDHGGGDHHEKKSNFGMFVGITMAMLGVLLAFCAARVGAERTELVQELVNQQNAHAKYQGQDVKHRVAVLQLQGLHAQIVAGANLDHTDVLDIANTVERYLAESKAAKEWTESYEPVIEAHIEGQEHYELGQLFAEIGIVIASVALLLKRKIAWFASLGLGGTAIVITLLTWMSVSDKVEKGEDKIKETGTAYRDLRNADKTTDAENALVSSVRAWAR
jgi:hypothetical protein